VVTPELVALLRDAQKNRKQEDLAKLLGIGAPHLSRVSAGKGPTLGDKALLKLAELENLDAGAVLRAAGKKDLARFRSLTRTLPPRKLQALRELLPDTSGAEHE
jgi:transcriptional regulator with XRE-family HTH domain